MKIRLWTHGWACPSWVNLEDGGVGLRVCQLSSKARLAFALALSKPNMITVLNLSKNKLGDEGVGRC